MVYPVFIDPGITDWKGAVTVNIDYKPLECIWNGGYTWNDPACLWNNGLDINTRFSFDLDYDINSDSNWLPCILTNGDTASDLDIDDTFNWHVFRAAWNIILGITGSDNCRLRCRVKNKLTDVWSDYGYFGPFTIRPIGYPFFTYDTEDELFLWTPTAAPNYPTPLLKINANTENKISVRGSIETIKNARDIQHFELNFPNLPLADITSFKTFLANINYKKETFRYYTREVNPESPFDGTWIYINCKIENAQIKYSHIRSNVYNLLIKLRKTQ